MADHKFYDRDQRLLAIIAYGNTIDTGSNPRTREQKNHKGQSLDHGGLTCIMS